MTPGTIRLVGGELQILSYVVDREVDVEIIMMDGETQSLVGGVCVDPKIAVDGLDGEKKIANNGRVDVVVVVVVVVVIRLADNGSANDLSTRKRKQERPR